MLGTVTVHAAPVSQAGEPATDHQDHGSLRARARRITARRLGNSGDGPRVLVIGAIHGNERAGIAIVRRLAHDAESRQRAALGRRRPQPRRRAREHPRQRASASTSTATSPGAGVRRYRSRHDVLRRAAPAVGAREPVRAPRDPAAAARHHDLVPPVGDGRRHLDRQQLRSRRASPAASRCRCAGSCATPAARRPGRRIASRRPRRSSSSCRPAYSQRARGARVRASGARSASAETPRPDTMLASKQVLETGAHEDAGRAGNGRAAARRARHHLPLPARDRGRRGPHPHRALHPRHHLAPRLAATDRARRDRARQPDDALSHRRPARRRRG